MVGAHQNLNGSHHLTTPFATINPSTKLEVPISTHCVDIEDNPKYRKWNGLG